MTALVIGNSAYQNGPLTKPVNDANDISKKLESFGFAVHIATDCTAAQMQGALATFSAALDGYDIALFFFAGHGIQIDGENWLLAIDTDTRRRVATKQSSLGLDLVLESMAESSVATKIIILDACRSSPLLPAWYRSAENRGLASVFAPKGTIIGFATSPGEDAGDGTGRNGVYTAALLHHIDTPDCAIELIFKKVRNEVAAATNGEQTPWEHTSLSGDFYFTFGLEAIAAEYGKTALRDELFIVNDRFSSHRVIRDLKVLTWTTQNAALDHLNEESANKTRNDTLFVIGRNVYQAACGGAWAAIEFIKKFPEKTRAYASDKRKALLDGILFEIFFDAKGKLRDAIKGGYFEQAFDLQKHKELEPSFQFIAGALSGVQANLYTLPGKGHIVNIGITTTDEDCDDDEVSVQAIYLGSVNVLRTAPRLRERHVHISQEDFEKQLSHDLATPKRLLKVTYTPLAISRDTGLKCVAGWTVRKP